MTESFRTSAARLDTMMARIDKEMLAGDRSIVDQATKAMQALRATAEKLDKAVGGNADQLTSVARRSLQEIELLARDGIAVAIVAGDADNIKITLPEDLALAASLLDGAAP